MATTKSFAQQVKDVCNARMSKAAKKAELTKLGLTEYEIDVMLDANINAVPVRRNFTITFGVEMETFNVDRSMMISRAQANGLPIRYERYNHHDSHSVFRFVTDASIRNNNGYTDNGCIECVTPVLKGRNGKKALENACKTLNEAGAKVNRTTGLHVHIGAAKLTAKGYVNVFVNYQMMESVIDSFMGVSRRGNNNCYCQSLKGKDFSLCANQQDVLRALYGDRYYKVNPCSFTRHKTIEFRQHQGSTNYDKIIAWVNFCAKLVVWSIDNKLTSPISTIDEIPFLTDAEKRYFNRRKNELA